MVYNIHNYWVSGLCPSSVILKTRKKVSEAGCFRSQVEEETHTVFGSSERANLK
jgi:hypothetical protein